MATIEKSIEVNVPLSTTYNQWTQFEEFPRFMEGVEEVTQLDDNRLSWRANVGGQTKEWHARITEQTPDERIAWTAEGGDFNAGVVTFHRISDDVTRVMLQMDYEPEGIIEEVGDKLGFVSRRVEGDLERFKEFVEERGQETGAWRGSVSSPGVSS
ncbi:MAG TPA: SRPBCC family protein [Dehalococcoidia bacterium]|nr:SRPBCC family protein [Dehalococcoidia bacterium]